MQPNRYINELEHWRRTSQRPEPYEESSDQSPTQSPTMDASEPIGNNSQNYDPNLLEHDYTAKSPSNAFPVEAPRGWLEYSLIPPSPPHASEGSSIQGGSRVTPNKSDIANKMNRKHRPYSTDHCIGSSQSIPSTPVAADPSSSNSGTTDSQTARDMLGAVSYEDIVKLTQMTAHLPDTSLVSKYHVNRGHNRQRSEETRSTKEYMRTISAVRPPQFDDAFPDISQQQIYDDHRPRADPNPSISAENVITMEPEPIITRPSMSTPPPSSIQAPLMPRPIKPFDPLKSDRRRSWYKQLVKRDKSKLKSTDSPLPGRHAPHIPSSPYDTSLPMMKRDESPSNDMRQIPTDQQLESGLTHGGSDGVSSVDHDPEINTRKRTALRPGTFIRDRLRKASHVELNEGRSSAFTPRDRSRFSPRRHSLDSMQSAALSPTTEVERRNRRRSSADDRKSQNIYSDRKISRQSEAVDGDRSRPEEADVRLVSPEYDIRPSFDFSSPFRDTTSPLGEDGSDSFRFYPSGSEDGIKSSCESFSDQISIHSGTVETPEGNDQRSILPEEHEETVRTLVFDYASLPDEVLGLLKEYEKRGKLEITEKRIRNDYELEREDESEDESDGESIIDGSHIVGGVSAIFDSLDDKQSDMKLTSLRKIATVRARQSDKEEFVKLIHLTDGNSMRDGYLLDLHVSMLGESDENMEDEITQEDLQMLVRNMDKRIEDFKRLAHESNDYLEEQWKTIESLISEPSNRSPQESSSQRSQRMGSRNRSSTSISSIKEAAPQQPIEDGSKQSRKQRTSSVDSTSSSPSNSASSINTASATSAARGIRQTNYSSLKRASSVWLERHLPYRSVNPFDYRQEEVLLGVQALENEMTEFRQALYETEDLIRNIQNDISDTRQKMTSYIKDMPDTHYSALKKLEVDIEGILANRAKNPWLDTGYAILSYILTLFALLVWIIICGLKWGRTVVLFPRKLWRTYSDYLVERNKAVKKASIRAVSSGVELNTSMHTSSSPRRRIHDT